MRVGTNRLSDLGQPVEASDAASAAGDAASVDADAARAAASAPKIDESGRPSMPSNKRIVNAASVEVISYAASTALRLGSNLVLTRLLMPEAFGLMALLTSVVVMLSLLSEVGLSQAVVMSPRGDDPKFLDTVFTLQTVRGATLWGVCLLLTYPLSLFFREPALTWILPIGSLGVVIHGFSSTRPYSLRRQLRPAPILILDLCANICGLATTITGAWLGYGVKALVAGVIVSQLITSAVSHFLPGSTHRVHFRTDPECRHEILHFGRWIFLSSALTAVAERGDQMLLGRLLGAASLGIYNIALALAEMPGMLVGRVLGGVVYPALARVKNENPAEFGNTYYRLRAWIDPLAHIAMGGVIGVSDWVVDLLYDDRYLPAAAMLRVLAVRTSVGMVAMCCEYGFIALGESKFSFRRNLFVSVVLLISLPIGDHLAGGPGVLWASVLARSTALLALWPGARRRGFFRFGRELLVLPYLGFGYLLGQLLVYILPDV